MKTTQKEINIHGAFLKIFGKGVVITGDSGIGKSETTLELVQKGHLFIVDDAVVVKKQNNKLFGESPEIIKNLVELRGIGIVDIVKLFGEKVTLKTYHIDYIINLKIQSKKSAFDRIVEQMQYREILGVKIPLINLPVSAARNIAMLIELAIKHQIIKEKGYNTLDVLQERLNNAK